MSTPPQQTSSLDMNRTTQINERRQQTDRRRCSSRREADRQHPEQSFQFDRDNNAEEQKANNPSNRKKILKKRLAVHALSEDEIRFLLEDD